MAGCLSLLVKIVHSVDDSAELILVKLIEVGLIDVNLLIDQALVVFVAVGELSIRIELVGQVRLMRRRCRNKLLLQY